MKRAGADTPRPLAVDACFCGGLHAPGFRRREGDRVERLETHLAPASARREPGHRSRQAAPRPDRLQRTLRLHRPAVDAATLSVDRVEEPTVACEVLIPQ